MYVCGQSETLRSVLTNGQFINQAQLGALCQLLFWGPGKSNNAKNAKALGM